MSFLNPALLMGAFALAIPIIVHLLNRRRFKRIKWAAMRFLEVSLERNQRRMKVEDWILLLLRLAIVALIVLALSRPASSWIKSTGLGSTVAASIIVDSSASMQRIDQDSTLTRFQIAKNTAMKALDSIPKGSSSSVLFAANSQGLGIKEPSHDKKRITNTINDAKSSDRGSDLFPAIQASINSLNNSPSTQRELIIITDGESSAWKQFESISRALNENKENIKTTIALVGNAPDENIAITSLSQKTPIVSVGQPMRLSVGVTNFGELEINDLSLQISINENNSGLPINIESIKPNEEKIITTFVEIDSPGYLRINAEINHKDSKPVDNSRQIVIRAIEKIKTLLIDGEPGRSITESETFFLQNALIPVPEELVESFFISTDKVNLGSINDVEIDDYDVIFLANVPDFSEEIITKINNFVKGGGGLVVFPGDNINTSFYNQELHEKINLLPASYGKIIPEEGSTNSLSLQASGYNHPLVELWNDPGAGTLGDVKTVKAIELVLNDETNGNVAVQYSSGAAAVIEADVGLGKVYQFSSSADTEWNDLPVKAAFLPIIHRVVGSVISRMDSGLNIQVGETFVRNVPQSWINKEATIAHSKSETASFISAEKNNQGANIQFEEVNTSGIYDLKLTEPFELIQFSATSDPKESNPEKLSEPQIERLKELSSNFIEAPSLDDITSALNRKRNGAEIWPLLLLTALLLTLLELYLSQKFSQEK